MNDSRITIKRPVDNRRFYIAIGVSACTVIAYFVLAASTSQRWMLYPLGLLHLIGLLVILYRRPSASVVVDRDSIAWHGDGLFWPASNIVSFIEIDSVEFLDGETRSRILLHNRYSGPWTIANSCFVDGPSVLSAIRHFRPDLHISITGG